MVLFFWRGGVGGERHEYLNNWREHALLIVMWEKKEERKKKHPNHLLLT